jgi:DNA-binding transcriptional regulator YiaG
LSKAKHPDGSLSKVKPKREDAGALSPLAREMVENLHALCDAVEAGVPMERVATVRTYQIDVTLPTLGPGEVRSIRESLGLSQSLFADFLGVAPATVRSWEQGQREPSALARRFLSEIRDDPAHWRARLARRATLKEKIGNRDRG